MSCGKKIPFNFAEVDIVMGRRGAKIFAVNSIFN